MRDFRNEIRHEDIGSAYESSPVGEEALRLGVEAVGILVTLEVPSQTLWVPKSIKSYEKRVGRSHWDTRTQTEHVMHYFNSGQAWQIAEEVQQRGDSTLIVSRTAIDDQGRVFKRWAEKGAKNIVSHRRVDRDQPVEGFVSPKYLSPPRAIEEINSDEFQTGIFSLIGGYGIYRTAVEAAVPVAHHDSSAVSFDDTLAKRVEITPGFRDLITQRVGELDRMDADAAVKAEELRLRDAAKEAAQAQRAQEALDMGREVVNLLNEHSIPILPIRRADGNQLKGNPSGWHIYTADSTSFDSTGYPFDYTVRRGVDTEGKLLGFKALDQRSTSVILDPDYSLNDNPEQAIIEMKSDLFQLGVAMLISGRGIYKGRA